VRPEEWRTRPPEDDVEKGEAREKTSAACSGALRRRADCAVEGRRWRPVLQVLPIPGWAPAEGSRARRHQRKRVGRTVDGDQCAATRWPMASNTSWKTTATDREETLE